MLLQSKAAVRILLNGAKNNAKVLRSQPKRNGGHGTWCYRMPPPAPSKRSIYLAEALGGICWWWILYHLWTEPDHIYGEWKYVYPSTWTDEELGIPALSEGSVAKV